MFGGSPSPPKPPPLPPPEPPPPKVDLEALAAQRKALEAKRRSRGSLVIQPDTASNIARTGLRIG
jgi:hypothetical protein